MIIIFGLILPVVSPCLSQDVLDDTRSAMLELHGDLRVHDPVIIREGDVFYIFSTGGGRQGKIIPIRRSIYSVDTSSPISCNARWNETTIACRVSASVSSQSKIAALNIEFSKPDEVFP